MTTTTVDEANALLCEISAASRALLKAEPEEINSIRTGNHKVRAGAGGQYFTTWDTAHGMLRDWACGGLYPLLRLAESNETGLTPPQLLEIWQATAYKYSTYLGYSGFDTLHSFERRAYAVCAAHPDTDTVIAMLREVVLYANLLTGWSHHYFPWGVGAGMRYAEASEAPSGGSALSTAVASTDAPTGFEGPRIEITWEPVGVRAEAVLASSLNPELVEEFISALPFTILQEHALVSGESMFAWTPLVSTAPVRHNERICDAPIGRLRYSQNSGQKFIVQYGLTTENLAAPVLGQIIPEHRAGLAAVGEAAWRNTLDRHEDIWVSVRLV
jgi:hypothetical protein